jgi:hypothetical protein
MQKMTLISVCLVLVAAHSSMTSAQGNISRPVVESTAMSVETQVKQLNSKTFDPRQFRNDALTALRGLNTLLTRIEAKIPTAYDYSQKLEDIKAKLDALTNAVTAAKSGAPAVSSVGLQGSLIGAKGVALGPTRCNADKTGDCQGKALERCSQAHAGRTVELLYAGIVRQISGSGDPDVIQSVTCAVW